MVNGQGTWFQLQDFPQAGGRSGTTSFTIGNIIYYATGINDSNGPNAQNWAYNISTNTWVQKTTAQFSPRFFAISFSINGKGYLGSGNLAASRSTIPTASNDFYEYDPVNDTWILKNAIGPTGRYGAVGFTIGNKGYVAFGANSTILNLNTPWVGDLVPSIYEYQPLTGFWTLKASSGTFSGTINAQVFVLDSKAYVVGGFVPGAYIDEPLNQLLDGVTIKNTIEYNPSNDSWNMKSSIPATWERHLGSSFSMLDRGYITGGHIRIACSTIYTCYATPAVLKYNPYLDNWSIISTSIPLGSFARAASVSNCDYGYVSTGARLVSGAPQYNHLNFRYEDSPDAF